MLPPLQELDLLNLPGLKLYALCALILALKMLLLAAYTGAVRRRHRLAINPEDALVLNFQVATAEHPEVERVQRAHRNDLENVPVFWALGLLAVVVGAPPLGMSLCFIAFTLSRILHTVFYLRALQPWRTLSFLLGTLSNAALIVLILVRVLSA